MHQDQVLILVILAVTIGLFLWGRWRHDMVAVGGLLACVLSGLVPADDAFAGFGHPAVITVACVLVLSRGLQTSGAVDAMARYVLPRQAGPTLSLAALVALGAMLSAFMNNVGAMALLMPVALQLARRLDMPPGRVLMPLAFGTILGGMTTLIGTPSNLIVSAFRAQNGAGSFGMFDFTPVGLAVALLGTAFVALVGWRLVPARQRVASPRIHLGGAAPGRGQHGIGTCRGDIHRRVHAATVHHDHHRALRPEPAQPGQGSCQRRRLVEHRHHDRHLQRCHARSNALNSCNTRSTTGALR